MNVRIFVILTSLFMDYVFGFGSSAEVARTKPLFVSNRRGRRELEPSPIYSYTLCAGERQRVTCPQAQTVLVATTFFGKLSGHDCSMKLHSVRNQIPTCLSPNTEDVIGLLCNGKQYCDVVADRNKFIDPCPHVRKYLYVEYTCERAGMDRRRSHLFNKPKTLNSKKSQLPPPAIYKKQEISRIQPYPLHIPTTPTYKSAAPQIVPPYARTVVAALPQSTMVCHGENSAITCPPMKYIDIRSAFFGKQLGRDCKGDLTGDATSTCYASSAVEKLREKCSAENSCRLSVVADMFPGSTCAPDVVQYLNVRYTCEDLDFLNRIMKMSDHSDSPPSPNLSPVLPPPETKKLPIQTLLLCTGQSGSASCPSNTDKIKIRSGFFGKQLGRDCSGNLDGESTPTCFAPEFPDIVREQCEGRNSCQLKAELPSNEWDTCNGHTKQYMHVQYTCLPGVNELQSKRQSIFRPSTEENADMRSIPREYLDSNGLSRRAHDVFANGAMAMSGLVIEPSPRMRKVRKQKVRKGKKDDDREKKSKTKKAPRADLNNAISKLRKKQWSALVSPKNKHVSDSPAVIIDATR